MDNYTWAVLIDLVYMLNAPFSKNKLDACKQLEKKGFANYSAESGICGYWYPTENGVKAVKEKLK